jgi:hypothetical protein
MDIQQMMRQLQGGGAPQAAPGADIPTVDNAETVYISSLALLKVRYARGRRIVGYELSADGHPLPTAHQMLKHGRAGVPLEVMGLMLGEFVDEFTISVIGELQRGRVVYQVELQLTPTSAHTRRCIRDASVRNWSLSRGCGPSIPNKDARHAQADWTVSYLFLGEVKL